MKVTILYAGLLTVLYLVLTFRTILLRRALGVSLGDGQSPALRRAIRAHANFAEYAPLALTLLFLAEQAGMSSLATHATGLALVTGRLLHSLGVSRLHEPLVLRMIGMVLTNGCLMISGGYLLAAYARTSLAA